MTTDAVAQSYLYLYFATKSRRRSYSWLPRRFFSQRLRLECLCILRSSPCPPSRIRSRNNGGCRWVMGILGRLIGLLSGPAKPILDVNTCRYPSPEATFLNFGWLPPPGSAIAGVSVSRICSTLILKPAFPVSTHPFSCPRNNGGSIHGNLSTCRHFLA